jgi:hypothetical protein
MPGKPAINTGRLSFGLCRYSSLRDIIYSGLAWDLRLLNDRVLGHMNPLPIGDGEIRVLPLAFESFGVRSMCTFIQTDDLKLVVDPGSALGPRFNLSPHEEEYVALASSRQRILEWARKSDLLTVSHYHFDHYVPNFEDWKWIWSSAEFAEKLYRGKLVLAKDTGSNINLSQRKRGYMFWKLNSEIAEIKSADNQGFGFGGTTLEFSKPVPHGPLGSQIGCVLMLTVKTKGCTLIHASDVQGPMEEETLRLILNQKPDAVIAGGPPLYLRGFKVEEEDIARGIVNMTELVKRVHLVIMDHHFLRSLDYREFLNPVVRESRKHGHEIITASELLGQKPQLLEARRKELHAREPVKREWYERLEKGEFKEKFV